MSRIGIAASETLEIHMRASTRKLQRIYTVLSVRDVHALASETSPSQLINHVTCVDVPPSPTLPRSIININVTTTRYPSTSSHHLINRSVVPPGFPCIPPSSSVVAPNHIHQNQAAAQVHRRPMLQTLAALDNCQDRISLSDARHLAAQGASWIEGRCSGRTASGFYTGFIHSFPYVPLSRFGLRLVPPFASVFYSVPLVLPLFDKYTLLPSLEEDLPLQTITRITDQPEME